MSFLHFETSLMMLVPKLSGENVGSPLLNNKDKVTLTPSCSGMMCFFAVVSSTNPVWVILAEGPHKQSLILLPLQT